MHNTIQILICCFLLTVVHQPVQSQTHKNKVFIGTNLAHLLHSRAPAIDLIMGYSLTDDFAIRASGGPIIKSSLHDNLIKIVGTTGWQAGLGVRRNLIVSKKRTLSTFGELRLKHKNVHNTIAGDFRKSSYFKRINYTVDVSIWDIQAGIGQAWHIKRFRIECLLAIGRSDVNVVYGNIPDEVIFYTNQIEESEKSLYEPGSTYEVYPTHLFTAEFTIGYLLF